jgi:hypothetical protein
VRYKWLLQHYWESINKVQEFATQWMYKYNFQRPNMELDGITPKQRLGHGCLMKPTCDSGSKWGGLP